MRICGLLILCFITLFPSFTSAQTEESPQQEIAKAWESGQTALSKDDYKTAESAFDKVVALDPEDGPAYFNRGYARLMLAHDGKLDWEHATKGVGENDLTAAIADFSKAIQFDAKDAEAYAMRGFCHKAQGNWDAAIADTQKAAELDANFQEIADMMKGTRFGRYLLPGLLTVGALLCAVFVIPFAKSIAKINAAEKAGRA